MSLSNWIRQRLGLAPRLSGKGDLLLGELEFVLVDIDLTGIDVNHDVVTGLAALPVNNGVFRPTDLHYCPFLSPANEDLGGQPKCLQSYQAISELLADRVVFTLNPNFVQHMLAKTLRRSGLALPPGTWLDLSAAAGVVGSDSVPVTTLPYWQKRMHSGGRYRYDATYDVFAMAHWLQALLSYVEDTGIETLADLMRNQRAENWLRPY